MQTNQPSYTAPAATLQNRLFPCHIIVHIYPYCIYIWHICAHIYRIYEWKWHIRQYIPLRYILSREMLHISALLSHILKSPVALPSLPRQIPKKIWWRRPCLHSYDIELWLYTTRILQNLGCWVKFFPNNFTRIPKTRLSYVSIKRIASPVNH